MRKNTLKEVVIKIKRNNIIKNVLYWCVVGSLFLYLFSIPSFSGREKYNLISYVAMAVLVGFTFLFIIFYSKPSFNRLFFVPISFVLFAFLGTAIYSHEYRRWLTLPLMLITMFAAYYSFKSIDNKKFIFKIFIFSFLTFAIYFIIHYRHSLIDFSDSNSSFLRVGSDSYFDNVNTVGFYFAIGFSLSLFVALFAKKKIEFLYFFPALIFFILGISTGSRAFIMVTLVVVTTTIYIKLKRRKLIFFLCFAAIIGLTIFLINLPPFSFLKTQFERMIYTLFGIGDSKIDASTYQRLLWQRYAWDMAGKNMITGYGCDGFAIFSGIGRYSHNNYAEVVCNFGIVGLILYYASFLLPLLFTFRCEDNNTHMVIILVLLYLVRNFFGVTYYSKDSYLILALIYYLIYNCKFLDIRKTFLRSTNNNYLEVSI